MSNNPNTYDVRTKKKLTLSIDPQILQWARSQNLNLSSLFQNYLLSLRYSTPRLSSPKGEDSLLDARTESCPMRDLNPRRWIESNRNLGFDASSLKADFVRYLRITRGIQQDTAESYERDISNFLEWSGNKISREHIGNYLLHLRDNNYASNSVRLRFIALKHLANWQNRPEWVRGIKTPSGTTIRRYEIPSPEQLTVCWNELINDEERALFLVSLSTGLRRGEIFSLRWEDLNIQERSIDVHHQTVTKRAAPFVLLTKQCVEFLESMNHVGETIIKPRGGKYANVWRRVYSLVGLRIGPQCLRVHYAVRARQVGLSDSVVNFLQGRSARNPLEASYSPWTRSELKPLYRKLEPKVTVDV